MDATYGAGREAEGGALGNGVSLTTSGAVQDDVSSILRTMDSDLTNSANVMASGKK